MYGIYLNSERIPKALRKALMHDVIGSLDISLDGLIPHKNIFFGEVQNPEQEKTEPLFFQTVFSLGYTFGGTAPLPAPTQNVAPKYISLKYISQPSNVSPLFSSSETIDIQGTAPAGTDKVVVNDYALQ
jgi:hypothetical protein